VVLKRIPLMATGVCYVPSRGRRTQLFRRNFLPPSSWYIFGFKTVDECSGILRNDFTYLPNHMTSHRTRS